jgi:hypothetical protein
MLSAEVTQAMRTPFVGFFVAIFNIAISFTEFVDQAYKVGQLLAVFGGLVLTCFLIYKTWVQTRILKKHEKNPTTPPPSDV